MFILKILFTRISDSPDYEDFKLIDKFHNLLIHYFHAILFTFFFMAAVLTLLLLTTSCTTHEPGKEPPVAVNGVIDLKDWDFEKDGMLELKGGWKFKWMENREEFSAPDYDDSEWEVFPVPQYWNEITGKQYGYCWLRIEVKNCSLNDPGVFLQFGVTAYDIFCNGEKILSGGTFGTRRSDSVPQKIPKIGKIPAFSDFVLSWRISNYHHIYGGPKVSPVLGTYTNFNTKLWEKISRDTFIVGIILMMCVYHFFLWIARRKDKASLYFFLGCIVMITQTLSMQNLITIAFPEFDIYNLLTKIEFINMPLCMIFFLIFLKELFPYEFLKGIYNFVILINCFYSLFLIITPARIFLYSLFPAYIFYTIAGFWILLSIIWAFRNKRKGSGILLLGFVFIIISSINDMFIITIPFFSSIMMQYGIVCFIFAQSIALSFRFADAYKTAEYLSENLQKEVAIKTRKIAAMAKEKTGYFINLAHETKTPLTLISNYLDKYIQERGMDKNLAVIKENISKLKTDMVNFLDYEKLDKGQIFYNHDQATDFSAILQKSIILFKESAKNKDISVIATIEKEIYVKADPYAIDRVVNNVIDNALKFTPNGGRITITLDLEKNSILFKVRDTGRGIPKDRQKNIFDPYYQVSHAKQNIQGIGMGLNIVKKIIDELAGRIELESEVDKGTLFKITLKKHESRKEERIYKDIVKETIVAKSTRRVPEEVKIVKGKYNVFIVEDNLDMLAYLQDSLKDTYNVFYALNGEEALYRIDRIPLPNIIISDIMMDVMDGYEFYEKLKMKIEYNFVPFVFLTAINSEEKRIAGIKKGAVDFISKPFNIEELKAKIESIIKLQESQKVRSELEVEERVLHAIRNRKIKDEELYSFEEKCSAYGITEREKDVILMILKGLEDKEVSSGLHVSFHTVRTHMKNIYKKCNVQNKVELVNLFKNV